MASVEIEAELVLAACKGLKTAIYAEVGGGTLAPVTALFKPEYSDTYKSWRVLPRLRSLLLSGNEGC